VRRPSSLFSVLFKDDWQRETTTTQTEGSFRFERTFCEVFSPTTFADNKQLALLTIVLSSQANLILSQIHEMHINSAIKRSHDKMSR
jgi:hypothetical protein